MRNTIIEKAQELGSLIAESPEKERLVNAGDAMNNDEEATTLLRTYNENRKTATENLRGKEPTKEELEEYRNYVQAEFNKIAGNKLIAEYIEASKEFDLLVNQVNAVLSYFITGEEQASAEGGCSGNCSSCSSCH
ncbi:MAG: YlbF family regulator [Clostridia bacterium]|nr:YlbF family regulator [Clostridia bacterium]